MINYNIKMNSKVINQKIENSNNLTEMDSKDQNHLHPSCGEDPIDDTRINAKLRRRGNFWIERFASQSNRPTSVFDSGDYYMRIDIEKKKRIDNDETRDSSM